MLLIVDANCSALFCADDPEECIREVIRWVSQGYGRIVTGGQLSIEHGRVGRFRRWLLEWERAGRLIVADHAACNDRTRVLADQGGLRSDDPHIIALAIISGARLLLSRDGLLIQDFKDPRILSAPRGRVIPEARARWFFARLRTSGIRGHHTH